VDLYCPSFTMHRLILILMIALLPLRTWAGDIMAVQMLTPTGFSQSAAVVDLSGASHEMQKAEADCPGHSADASGAEAKLSPQSHCNTCVACQICHSVTITVSTPNLVAQLAFAQAPTFDTPRFTSAQPALSQKPPIS
jgi:hypothetical protein